MASTRIPVNVHAYDGRPVYVGDVRAVQADGRYEVENRETGEVVVVPGSSVSPIAQSDAPLLARLRPEEPDAALEPFYVGAMIEASFPGKISMAGSDEYEIAKVVCASKDSEIADPERHDFDIVLKNGQTFRVIVTRQMAP